MAMKSIVGRVRSTQLEQSLSSTIVADYIPEIDSNFMSLLQSKGENIMLPSLNFFMTELAPGSYDRFVDLYNRTMCLEDGVENIPDEVKAVQGALFDGLCFGYDCNSDTVDLYTMNFDLLMNDLNINRDMASMCIDSNSIGRFKAFRIDVEYEVGPETFNFKAVNHRKVLDNESVIFLPYIACVRLMKMIESFLASGAVLKVKQEVNGVEKLRYITRNQSVLAKYCDSSEAVKTLEPSFFPLKAFFYAPVLGASSLTAMVSNVNLFDLCELKKIKADKISNLGIARPVNPVQDMLEEKVFSSELYNMILENPHAAAALVEELPRGTEVFAEIDNVSQLSIATFSKYLHGLTPTERAKAVTVVPGVQEAVKARLQVLEGGSTETIPTSEYDNLRAILKEHVCRFIIRKKNCKLSSILGTNNGKILAGIYGNDYFAKYEGFGVRFYEVFEEFEAGRDLESALASNGFDCSEDTVRRLKQLYDDNGRTVNENLKFAAADLLGYKTRSASSSSTDSILFRTLDATYSEESGARDYYKNIDPDKIVSAVILK